MVSYRYIRSFRCKRRRTAGSAGELSTLSGTEKKSCTTDRSRRVYGLTVSPETVPFIENRIIYNQVAQRLPTFLIPHSSLLIIKSSRAATSETSLSTLHSSHFYNPSRAATSAIPHSSLLIPHFFKKLLTNLQTCANIIKLFLRQQVRIAYNGPRAACRGSRDYDIMICLRLSPSCEKGDRFSCEQRH